jgi:hypothetical protein
MSRLLLLIFCCTLAHTRARSQPAAAHAKPPANVGDIAFDLDPRQFLAYRGWCRFEFLRDYAGAMEDLRRFDTLSEFSHTSSNDGDYELHLVVALCERELGDTGAAFHYFGVAMDADRSMSNSPIPGTGSAGCISPRASGRWPKKCSSTRRSS